MVDITAITQKFAAKRLAKGAGHKWLELSKEQRKSFVVSGRKNVLPQDENKARLFIAKKEVKRAGKNWTELTKIQQKEYISQVPKI